jgi:hypothetical protein
VSPDPLTELSPGDRNRLEAILVDFDLHWAPEQLSAVVARLPPDGPFRRAALAEMVKIDRERHAGRGRDVPVRDYLGRFPELFPAGTPASDLLAAETAAQESLPRAGGPGSVHLPEQFGRYRIIRPLGQGGMGGVYLARDGDLDRLVALKVPLFSPDDAEAVERFTREARAAATIDHPNVCRVYDVGRIDGLPYITMEYVEGPTLAGVLKGGPLPPRQAVQVARDVARALAEAHRLGVVHRDLKPANILLQGAGDRGQASEDPRPLTPKVADFGLARRDAPDESRLTAEGVIAGTPMYMSPEQASGDRAGPASDVYSLGVVLYEMATGRPPFGGTRADIFSQTLTVVPPAPSSLQPDVGPRLDAIALKALAKRPGDRFSGMTEFADALDESLTDDGRDQPRGRASVRIGLAGGVVLLVLALAVLVRQWGEYSSETPRVPAGPRVIVEAALPATSQRALGIVFSPDGGQVYTATDEVRLVVRRWDVATGQAGPGEVHRSLHSWATFAPTGRWVLVGGGLSPELRRTESADPVLTLPDGVDTASGAVSPDGRWIIVGTHSVLDERHRARVYDRDSPAEPREYDGHQEEIRHVAVSADGVWAFSASADRFAGWEVGGNGRPVEGDRNGITCVIPLPESARFVTGSRAGGIAAYDLTAGPAPFRFEDRHTDAVTCLAASADGRFVVSGSADHMVRVWDAATGRELWTLDGPASVACVAMSPDGRRLAAGGTDRTWRVWELPE